MASSLGLLAHNLIGDPACTWEFLTALRDEGLNLKWNGAVSANLIDHLPLLDLMWPTRSRP